MHDTQQVLPAADAAAPTANLPFLPLQLPMLILMLILVLVVLGFLPVQLLLANACTSWHCSDCSSCCF
jgi:hypothetical protein